MAVVEVSSWAQLQAINNGLAGEYLLVEHLNKDSAGYSTYNSGNGWLPIGNNTNYFTGKFNGNGYSISDLKINRGATNYVGLFGYIRQGTINNLTIKNFDITGKNYVGTLAGWDYFSHTGSNMLYGCKVVGNNYTAGYIGRGEFAYVDDVGCYGMDVYGNSWVAGLIGDMQGRVNTSRVSGKVRGASSYVGGFYGRTNPHPNGHSSTAYCYSICDVIGTGATGRVGGFSGQIDGSLYWETYVNRCYSAGSVTRTDGQQGGGFVGIVSTYGAYPNKCFFDSDKAGDVHAVRGIPKTTEEMMDYATFSPAEVWGTSVIKLLHEHTTQPYKIRNHRTYPLLWFERVPLHNSNFFKFMR